MYRGFNLLLKSLTFDDSSYLNQVTNTGRGLHAAHKAKVKEVLDDFFTDDGELDASKMTANWFPLIESDIFISHSHRDEKTAILLAGWLKDAFGLNSFIDSCAWGYSDELLKLIDKKYCYHSDSETYSYEKRNRSTSHVHMMLSTALSKMIDKSECLFFLNTPHSITPGAVIDGSNGSTLSPWIYSEIAMTRLIHRRTPDQHRGIVKKALAKAEMMESLKVIYDLNLDHLTDLHLDDFNQWREKLRRGVHPLDVLYDFKSEVQS